MKKSYLKIPGQGKMFNRFLLEAGKLGFAPISPFREARNQIMQSVIPPDSPRVDDLRGQVIVQKHVDDLTIRVITTFDPVANKFPVRGKLWVRITTLSEMGKEERLFTWKTTRKITHKSNFLERALYMMEILAIALEHRPYDPSNKTLLMKLVEVDDMFNPFMWKGVKGNAGYFITKEMLPKGKPKLLEFYRRWRKSRWYYEHVARSEKRLGYEPRRERDSRKPYTRGKKAKK